MSFLSRTIRRSGARKLGKQQRALEQIVWKYQPKISNLPAHRWNEIDQSEQLGVTSIGDKVIK